jgi:uncharacterized surface protein with fasciclin (FAS1) repeats
MSSKKTASRLLVALAVTAAFAGAAPIVHAQVTVGGAPMYPTKDIIDNAVNSKDHTTLVAAVKAAGLVDTLKGPGPFTVFAPTNDAFAALPAGTVDTLLKPENKASLTGVLTYHVVPGKWDAAAITKMVADGKGQAMIKTVAGGTLKASAQGGKLMLTDEKGGMASVTIADVYQSNGVIHVIDKVLLPNPKQAMQSMRTRAQVQAEAMNPQRITNGGTGVMSVQSQLTREAVQQQAIAATRNGTAMYGEMGRMQ